MGTTFSPQKQDQDHTHDGAIDSISVNCMVADHETTEIMDSAVFGVIGEESLLVDFCPIQHPIEPPQDDKPVQCPLPHSSLISEGRLSDHRKVLEAEAEPEPTRKRHHSIGHGDNFRKVFSFTTTHNDVTKASTVEPV